MKFFFTGSLLLLVLGNLQGSTIPEKRSVEAPNSLQTNFNGHYERRDPCTNTEVEKGSYAVSHEFHRHSKEDSWSVYAQKCSEIIGSFFHAISSLMKFDGQKEGTFNFEINTTITHKNEDPCDDDGSRSRPTIVIETNACEKAPSQDVVPGRGNTQESSQRKIQCVCQFQDEDLSIPRPNLPSPLQQEIQQQPLDNRQFQEVQNQPSTLNPEDSQLQQSPLESPQTDYLPVQTTLTPEKQAATLVIQQQTNFENNFEPKIQGGNYNSATPSQTYLPLTLPPQAQPIEEQTQTQFSESDQVPNPVITPTETETYDGQQFIGQTLPPESELQQTTAPILGPQTTGPSQEESQITTDAPENVNPNEYQSTFTPQPPPQPNENRPMTPFYESTTISPMQQTEPQAFNAPVPTDSQSSDSGLLSPDNTRQESLPVYPNQFPPNAQPLTGPYDYRFPQGPQQQNGFRGNPSQPGNFYPTPYPQYYPPQFRGTTPFPNDYMGPRVPEAFMRGPEDQGMPLQNESTQGGGEYPPQDFGNVNQFQSTIPSAPSNQYLNNYSPSGEGSPYAPRDQLASTLPPLYSESKSTQDSVNPQPLDLEQPSSDFSSPAPNDNNNQNIPDFPVSNIPVDQTPQANIDFPEPQSDQNVNENSQPPMTTDSPVEEPSQGLDQMTQSRESAPNSAPFDDDQQQQQEPTSLEPVTNQPSSFETQNSFPVDQQSPVPPFYPGQSSPQGLTSDSLVAVNQGNSQPLMGNPFTSQSPPERPMTFNQLPTTFAPQTQFNNYPAFGQQIPTDLQSAPSFQTQPQAPVSYPNDAPNGDILSPAPEQSLVPGMESTIAPQQYSDPTRYDSLNPNNFKDDQVPSSFDPKLQSESQTSAFLSEPQFPNTSDVSSPLIIASDNSTVDQSNNPIFAPLSPVDASEPFQGQNQFPETTEYVSPQTNGFLPNEAQPEFSQQFPSNQMTQPTPNNYQSTPTPEQVVNEQQYSSENNGVPPSESYGTTISPERQPPSWNIPQAQSESLSSDSYQMASTPTPESQLQNSRDFDKQIISSDYQRTLPTEALPTTSLGSYNFQPSFGSQQQPNSVLYPGQFSPAVETTTVSPQMTSPFLQESTESGNAPDGNQSPPAQSTDLQSPSPYYPPVLPGQQPNPSIVSDGSTIPPQSQFAENQQMPINGLSVPEYQNKPWVAQRIEGEPAGGFPFVASTVQQPTTLPPDSLTMQQTSDAQPNTPGESQFDSLSAQGFPEARQTPPLFPTTPQPPMPFFSEQPSNNMEATNEQNNMKSFAPQPENESLSPYPNNFNQNGPMAFPATRVTYPDQVQNAPELQQQTPIFNYGQFPAVNSEEPVSNFNPVEYYPTIAPQTQQNENVTFGVETTVNKDQPSFPYEQQPTDSLFTPPPSYSNDPEPTAMPSFSSYNDQPQPSTSGLPDQDLSSPLTTPLPYFASRDVNPVEYETKPSQITEKSYDDPDMTSPSSAQPVNNNDFIKNPEEPFLETDPQNRSTDDSFITPSPLREERTDENQSISGQYSPAPTQNIQNSYPQEPFNGNPDTSFSQQHVNPYLPPSAEFQSLSRAPPSNAFPDFDRTTPSQYQNPPQPSFQDSTQNNFPTEPVTPVGNDQDRQTPIPPRTDNFFNYPIQNENSEWQKTANPNEYQPPFTPQPQPQPNENRPMTPFYESTTISPMQQTEPQAFNSPVPTNSQSSDSGPLPPDNTRQESLPVYPNQFPPNAQPLTGPYDYRFPQGPQQQNGFRGNPSQPGNFYPTPYPQYYPPQFRGTTPIPNGYMGPRVPEPFMRGPEDQGMPLQNESTQGGGEYPPQDFGNVNQFQSTIPSAPSNQYLNNYSPSGEGSPYAPRDQFPFSPSMYNAQNPGSSQPVEFNQPSPDYSVPASNDDVNQMMGDAPVSNSSMDQERQQSFVNTMAPEAEPESQLAQDSAPPTTSSSLENLSTNNPDALPNYFSTSLPPESEVRSSVTESDLVKESSQSPMTTDSPVAEPFQGQSRESAPNSSTFDDDQQQQQEPTSLEPVTNQPSSFETQNSFPVDQQSPVPPFYPGQSSPQGLTSDSLVAVNQGNSQSLMGNPVVPQQQPEFVNTLPAQSEPTPYSPFNRNIGERMIPYGNQQGVPGIPPYMRRPGPAQFQQLSAPNQMLPPAGNYPFRGPAESEVQQTAFQQQPLGFTPYDQRRPENESPERFPSYPQPQSFPSTPALPNEQDQIPRSPASLEPQQFFPYNQGPTTQQPQPNYNREMLMQPQDFTSPEFQPRPPSSYMNQVPQPQVQGLNTPNAPLQSDVGVNDQRNFNPYPAPNAQPSSPLPYPNQVANTSPPENQPSGYFNQESPDQRPPGINQGRYPPFFPFPDYSADKGNKGPTHTSSIIFVGKTPSKTEASTEGTPFMAYAHVVSTMPDKDEQKKNDEGGSPGQRTLPQTPDQPEPTLPRQPQMDSPPGFSDNAMIPPQASQEFPVQGFPANIAQPVQERPPFDQRPPIAGPNESYSFAPQNQEPFVDAPPYSQAAPEPNFNESQPNAGVSVDEGVTSNPQPGPYALVPEITTPSNIPGENNVSCSERDGERLCPSPLLCPFNPDLKGNMTAPSYYILVSRLPADDGEERFQVEKVYLGDGTPLNCQTYEGKTFPTASYTEVPFSAVAPVNLRIKHDTA